VRYLQIIALTARRVTALALVMLAWPATTSAADDAPTCSGLQPAAQRTVTRIIDGETVALDDGSELRLIGALAPRALDAGAEPGLWPMEVAAKGELQAIVLGKSIDIMLGREPTDRYGRLQGHAFVHAGGQRHWLQGHLLEQGLARAYALAGDRTCAEALLASERIAREARRGLWAEAAYHVRPARRPDALKRYRATFQIVEGRVARVAQVRGTTYLNLEADRRRGLSVSLRRADLAQLGEHANAAKGLEGRHVRARGWLEERGGAPMIDLSVGGLLEIIEDTNPPRQSADGQSSAR
jgi:micrococcal nuclease